MKTALSLSSHITVLAINKRVDLFVGSEYDKIQQ